MARLPQRIAIHLWFLLSGMSGLIWQLCWVRAFGRLFGNTLVSASIVAGTFVAALGLGALLAGGFADRRGARPLRAYGWAELLIAGWGVSLALMLPGLDGWLGGVGELSPDAHGFLQPSWQSLALRILAAVVLVGAPAGLMGATLVLLLRVELGAHPSQAGFRAALLYGVNTLGAAAGALATDVYLIPSLGLWQTQLVAAGGNAVAGLGALCLPQLPRQATATAAVAEPEPARGTAAAPMPAVGGASPMPESSVLGSLFLGGFAALGFEILWLRFLGSALGSYRGVLSTLLAVHLCGLWLGATLAGIVSRVGRATRELWIASQCATALLALHGLLRWNAEALVHDQLGLRQALTTGQAADAGLLLPLLLRHVVGVVLLPSVAMGCAFPLANALCQQAGGIGRRSARLYLASTSGNLFGSLLVGLLLVPGLGTQGTALTLAAAALLGALLLARRFGQLLAPGLAGVLVVFLAARADPDQLLWAPFPAGRLERSQVLAVKEGREHTLVVTGSREGPAQLWTSGHPMTATTPHAQRYMRLLAHLPLLQMASPRRALVICFGVGNTLHAASLHPLLELDVVDVDRDILLHAPYFAHANRNVLRDPRVRAIVDDGRRFLRRSQSHTYDLITLEPPPIATAGTSALYSREFYAAARARLVPGGALSQWLPAYQVPAATVRSLVAAFVSVFPAATLHVGDGRELLLVGWNGGLPKLQPEIIEQHLRGRAPVRQDLHAHGVSTFRDLALTYAAGPQALARVAVGEEALVDDRPRLEYSQLSHVMETQLPPELLQPAHIADWCPGCPGDRVLMDAIGVLTRALHSRTYQRFSNLVAPSSTSEIGVDLAASDRAIVAEHASLRWLLGW